MPPFPGEETLTTLYADIHYYFAQPTTRPVLHRFDKASYFYVYYNSTRQTSRIEVANNPGTADQDAFNGYLNSCRVVNSHKFPNLVTLVVDGFKSSNASSSPTSSRISGRDSSDEWRLASADPRDPGKNKYRLHTMDVYFWQEENAKLVVDLFKKLLDPEQLDVVELSRPEEEKTREEEQHPQQQQQQQQQSSKKLSEDPVSPVVQNLENVAISDPAYHQQQNGKGRGSRNQPAAASSQSMNLPPPPPVVSPPGSNHPASASPVSDITHHDTAKHSGSNQNYTPMAYNPAAPAAPEPIFHREDTPPPHDDGHGTGLAAAALHDDPYGGGGHHQQQHPQSQSYASSPGPQQGRHPSIAAQRYSPHSPDPQQYNPQSVQTPGTQFYASINDPTHHRPLQHNQPQYADYLTANAPVGGYSQYQYGSPSPSQQQQQQQGGQGGGNSYDIHNQVYRPTETEHHHHHQQQQGGRTGSVSSKPQSRFDQRADKVEKSVGRLFKKIEKRIG